ncbi:sigma-54-dependent Fis family transcriptional regulator [Vulcanibacillus modesticaldus]|uniref:Sigma-54-dependent Fis family transcriptional regulator n=1 Tax=Vulcanibacillus modesticaldus TaxID=337097 RepID=A0A1D2YRV3_9BACI|nr:sigma-54-dependent Fis family transcriptional regulator [Vulcanibacillus modesticaldus]OEF95533.1 sigma-54-dependent Fis family transcriptional regulator [Vulcanibacillus modesticaldus]
MIERRALIIGAGKGGSALLKALKGIEKIRVIAIVDKNLSAPGISLAKEFGIETSIDFYHYLNQELDVIFDATGDPFVFNQLKQLKAPNTLVVSGTVANLIIGLIEEKEELIRVLSRRKQQLDVILNSTHDAMIAINKDGIVTLFNRAAERILNKKAKDVVGTDVRASIPNTRLPNILETGMAELNQKQELGHDGYIITNRVPIFDDDGNVIGAVAVFRDITDIIHLSEEITDLKSVRSMLTAIINSTEDAISVVDEHGRGLMINPAYTRLTGLSPEDVINKPADVDIYEGESMHMRVLKTKKPVRGVPMKVGPKRKNVIVNVAPILVDGELKGSVGIIHDTTEIKKLTEELEKARRIIRTIEAKYTFDDIIGNSKEMKLAIETAKKASTTHATVLIRGESGIGKELFAHAIHNASNRKFNQFVRVNCAAISNTLLESELFGYEEGAFTGAKKGGKKGFFEVASGGTIFLDEIGELELNTQAKLLRVLQEKEIVRVGGTKPIPVDVRIIAATNVNLEKAIKNGKFRKDLYYRLNVIPIQIPSLRERKSDIPLLTRHLIKKLNTEYGRKVEGISEEVLHVFLEYSWPGNVRELENILGRAIMNMTYNEIMIELDHLPPLGKGLITTNNDISTPFPIEEEIIPLNDMISKMEKEYLKNVLNKTSGNKTKAAQLLGISIRNLYYKLEKYGLN